MCHLFRRDARFWTLLLRIDQDIAEEARGGACRHCSGPLHAAHYPRTPRGAEADELSVEFRYRLSFSCGRDGCRKRLTPPSVRFLGPKLYLGTIIVLAVAMGQGPSPRSMRELKREFGADRRTISRWQKFWAEIFSRTIFWAGAKGQFMPPVDEKLLPQSLLGRFEGSSIEERFQAVLRFLAPITTRGGLEIKAS